jgi:hypothetical protein
MDFSLKPVSFCCCFLPWFTVRSRPAALLIDPQLGDLNQGTHCPLCNKFLGQMREARTNEQGKDEQGIASPVLHCHWYYKGNSCIIPKFIIPTLQYSYSSKFLMVENPNDSKFLMVENSQSSIFLMVQNS